MARRASYAVAPIRATMVRGNSGHTSVTPAPYQISRPWELKTVKLYGAEH